MRLTKIIIIFCITALVLTAGCADKTDSLKVNNGDSRTAAPGVETALLEAVNQGKLAEVYKKDIPQGQDNYIIIKNAYNEVRDYKIEACSGCEIMNELKIEADRHHIIKFSTGNKGEKTITITDSMNNHYASTTFKVI